MEGLVDHESEAGKRGGDCKRGFGESGGVEGVKLADRRSKEDT